MQDPTDYRKLRENIQRELKSKAAERSEIQGRLAVLQREIEGLRTMRMGVDAYLREEATDSDDALGITDAIRKVLAFNALRPTEVREALQESGFEIDGYKQPMAVIHTTLKRLKDQEDVESLEEDGVILYRTTSCPRMAIRRRIGGQSP